MMAGFEIARDGLQARIVLGRKLTVLEVPEIQPALKAEIAGGASEIIFDLSGMASLDSTGIGLLIAANNSMQASKGTIRLINASPDIFKLLRSMRLVDRLHVTAEGTEVADNG